MEKIEIVSDNYYIKAAIRFIIKDLKLSSKNKKISITASDKNLFTEREINSILKKESEVNIVVCSKKNANIINDIDGRIHTINISKPVGLISKKIDIACNTTISKAVKKNNLKLTIMERRVVSMFVSQASIPLISRLEKISEKNVSAHKRNAMKKMNVITNQELITKFNLYKETMSMTD